MSAEKHTPGPWLYRGKSDTVHQPSATHPYGKTIFRFHEDELPSDADHELIMAAPDLLEALIEVAAANAEALAAMAEDEITPPQWFVDQCEQVKAAIAKATGTTP